MECQAGAEGLEEVGEYANKGRGGTQIGGNVLQGGDTGSTHTWFGDLGLICGGGEDVGQDTPQVSEKIMGKQARRKAYGTWVNPKAEVVWEATGSQLSMTYIGIIQGMVAQWVVLRAIFEVCTRETVYDGGGNKRYA